MSNTVEKLSPAELKAELEAIWNKPGMVRKGSGPIAWSFCKYDPSLINGTEYVASLPLTPEQKARRKGLAMYNKALKASILAEATATVQDDGLMFYDFRNVFYDFRSAPKKAAEEAKPAKTTRKPRTVKAKTAPVAIEPAIETTAPVINETIDVSSIYEAAKGRRDELPKRPAFNLAYAKAKASMPNYATLAIIGAFMADLIIKGIQ